MNNIKAKHAAGQFYQWAVKWFYTNSSENATTKTDISSIICLLQAIGYKLCKFEERDQLHNDDNYESIKNGSTRITIECGTSKKMAILEMDDISCDCIHNEKAADDGSFWSITGTGLTDKNVEKTGSNLLPSVSEEVTSTIRDVTNQLFRMINNKGDANHKIDDENVSANNTITKFKNIGLTRSYTDFYKHNPSTIIKPDLNLSHTKSNSTKSTKGLMDKVKNPTLKRHDTYEIIDKNITNVDKSENNKNMSSEEPRTSPPTRTSSPPKIINSSINKCASLGQLSFESDMDMVSLSDYVIKAHQILDKAVKTILKHLPATSSPSSIQDFADDSYFIKPTPPAPLMSSSFRVTSPRSGKSSGSLFNRSVSNASLKSTSSIPSKSTLKPSSISSIRKPLGPMRDRSSSATIPSSRLTSASPSIKNLAANAAAARRKTTIGSGLAQQRTPSFTSKLPPVNKTAAKSQITSTPASQRNTSLLKAPSAGRISMSSANKSKR